MGLAPHLGRGEAHHVVKHACDVALAEKVSSPTRCRVIQCCQAGRSCCDRTDDGSGELPRQRRRVHRSRAAVGANRELTTSAPRVMLHLHSRTPAMPQLTLAQAQTIITTALKHGTDQRMQPLAVVVLDERGVPKAFAAQDGTSLRRFEIASGKAHGALSFGLGSRIWRNGLPPIRISSPP